MLHIEFITDLGARVTVDVESEAKLLDVQRQYGRLGWTSGDVPTGGYQFPLENEPDFDWSLIGARKWQNPEGEEMIIHRGYAYRRRELEAVDSRKIKLPAAVKYSRGAKNTDPARYDRLLQKPGLLYDGYGGRDFSHFKDSYKSLDLARMWLLHPLTPSATPALGVFRDLYGGYFGHHVAFV